MGQERAAHSAPRAVMRMPTIGLFSQSISTPGVAACGPSVRDYDAGFQVTETVVCAGPVTKQSAAT